MYWSPKRNHLVTATWNFVKASKVRKKIWWRKWRLFGGGCCHTSTEASQQVSVERAALPRRKPTFLTHSLLPRIVKELPSPKLFSKHRRGTLSQNGNHRQCIWVSVKANTDNEIRVDFLASPRMASPGSSYEMQTLRPQSAFWKDPQVTSMNIHTFLKHSELGCLWGTPQANWSVVSSVWSPFLFIYRHI